MAWYITQLDLAASGIRLFNCEHENFRNVPDGRNSTHEVSTTAVANHLFSEWMEDKQFIKEYNNLRRTMLQHHRAHERAQEGRGVASWRMKKEFVSVDEKRGVDIKY